MCIDHPSIVSDSVPACRRGCAGWAWGQAPHRTARRDVPRAPPHSAARRERVFGTSAKLATPFQPCLPSVCYPPGRTRSAECPESPLPSSAMPSDGVCGNLLKWTPWGLVLALQWLTAMAVLSELAPALTEPRRYTAVAALVAAFLLTAACVRDLQRFRTRVMASARTLRRCPRRLRSRKRDGRCPQVCLPGQRR